MPDAYSYLRWSTEEQSKGNSYTRQIAMRDRYLKARSDLNFKKNYTYKDAGLSGRGAHLFGAFGLFLEAAKSGKIKSGSYLLVEDLDRLGRMEVLDQLNLFLPLINAGIRIITLMDESEYSRETMKGPNGVERLKKSLNRMELAHEESEKKSVRSSANWKKIRKGADKNFGTRRVPGWLRVSADHGTCELIPDRQRIVLEIFEKSAAGWGKDRIAKALKERGVEPWGVKNQKGKYWHDTYVAKILANRAVIGECQWHKSRMDPKTGKKTRVPTGAPIANYFPPAIPVALWLKVQALREARAKRPGRIGVAVRNLFTGLIHCGHTGHSMAFSNKNPLFYLRSTALAAPKGIRLKPWCYEEFETAFFEFVGLLDPDGLVDPSTEPDRIALNERIAQLEVDRDQESKRLGNLAKQFADSELEEAGELRDVYYQAKEKRASLTQELETAKQEYEKLGTNTIAANEALKSITLIRESRAEPAFRLKLRDYLGQLIEGVWVYLDGEAEFGLPKAVVFNGAKGELADLAKNVKAAVQRKRKAANQEFVRAGRRMRGFTIAFTTGLTRTVIVTTEQDKPMTAHALKGRRKRIVRENRIARLVHDTSGGNHLLREGSLNLWPEDFDTEEEYLNFLLAYSGIVSAETQS